MSDYWPFLDISRDVKDCLALLGHIQETMGTLATDGCDLVAPLVGEVQALQELVERLLPPELLKAIAEEQRAFDQAADRWGVLSY